MKSVNFFKGLSWLIILNLLVKPVWIFFIDRRVQNIVGNEAYGKFFALLNLSYILIFIADAGLTNSLNQKLSINHSLKILPFFKTKVCLLISYITICLMTGWLLRIEQWDLFVYIILIQAFTSLFVFLRNIITAHQFFQADAWLSIADKGLMIFLCGGCIYFSFYFGSISLLLFLKIQLAATCIAVAIAFLFIVKQNLIESTDKEYIFHIKSILPFAVIILLMSIHYRLDGFLLERINTNGAYETGIYAAAYRLLDAGNMVGYLAASFLVPFISKHRENKPLIETTIARVKHFLIIAAIAMVCFTFNFASWIQELLYHSNYSYSALVIKFCLASLPAYYLVHIYGSALTATENFWPFNTILFISVVINIVLNVLLISSYGAKGCCIAALASQYFCGLTCYIIATKKLGLSLSLRSNLIYGLIAFLFFLFFYIGKIYSINAWLILIIPALIIAIFLSNQPGYFKKYFSLL